MTHTWPDISFAIGLSYIFSRDPHENHWQEMKRILRYTQEIARFCIQYSTGTSNLVGFIDSDWVGSFDD